MVKLQVYVSNGCWTCSEAGRVVADVISAFPGVSAELIDIDMVEPPASVFAVPTYLFEGHVIFLGNPSRQELMEKLCALVPPAGT